MNGIDPSEATPGVGKAKSRFAGNVGRSARLLVLGILFAVTSGVLVGSREFTWTWVGADWLFVLERGNLIARFISDRWNPNLNWDNIDYPAAASLSGLVRNAHSALRWNWPRLHESFSSPMGTWWELRFPLWSLLVLQLVFALHFLKSRRRMTSMGQPRASRNSRRRVAWRRMAFVTSLSATFFFGLIWGLNTKTYVRYFDGQRVYSIDRCALIIRWPSDTEVCRFNSSPGWDRWWSEGLVWELPRTNEMGQSSIGTWQELVLPFWFLVALSLIPVLRNWPHRERYGAGCCRKCGYDLTGNVSGVCPECGARNGFAEGWPPARESLTIPTKDA